MADDGVLVDHDDGVLRLTINRPDRKGSLQNPHQRAIVEALESASTDESLRVVLLSSVGDDFCTGADWVATNSRSDEKPRTGSIQRRTPLHAHRIIELLQEIQLPVVCRVTGWAAGLGCQLALASDFAVASDDARFWHPFVKRGFTPDSGSTWLVPRLIGVARAKEMLMLGRPIEGRQAAEWGLIHRAVPAGDLDSTVDELVSELRHASTVAVGLTKRTIHGALDSSLVRAMEAEAIGLELSSRSPDFREGLKAFADKRDPDFQGG